VIGAHGHRGARAQSGCSPRSVDRGRSPRGSVLILVPALVLVLLVLGAIAVDASIAYLGRRELADFTASAADRAAASALDKPAFYASGSVRIDPVLATQVVTDAEAVARRGGLDILGATVTVTPAGDAVTVSATASVRTVFGIAVGGRRSFTVRAVTTTDIDEVARR
jgi:Flp pilus assembly protein TadG